MSKTFPTYTFNCPRCQTQLRVRERRFVNREIECPACNAELLVQLNKAYQIEVEERYPDSEEVASTTPSTKREPINLNPLYWCLSGLLLALLGYVYIIHPQLSEDEVAVQKIQDPPVPTPEEQVPDVEEPEGAVQSDPVGDEREEDQTVQVKRDPVRAPRPEWRPRGLPPAIAERPAPPPIPIPEKWARLMQLRIARYQVPGLERGRVVEELELLADTSFVFQDDETRARLEDEPTEVSLDLKQTNFAEMLSKTLEPVGLTFKLTDEAIVIHSVETAELREATRQ